MMTKFQQGAVVFLVLVFAVSFVAGTGTFLGSAM